MEGILRIKCKDADTNKVIEKSEHKNIITSGIYNKLVHFLGGVSTGFINRIQLGTGTRVPVVSDTYLQAAITPILNVAAPVYNDVLHTVMFSANLEIGQGNGFQISEAGLLTDDDVLAARVTFTSRLKSVSYIFSFEWTVLLKPSS